MCVCVCVTVQIQKVCVLEFKSKKCVCVLEFESRNCVCVLEFESRNCLFVCVCVCVYGGGQISSLLTRTCLICGSQAAVFRGHLDLEVKKGFGLKDTGLGSQCWRDGS